MPEPPKSAEGSFRWWEFYAIRYAMGTIVGGVIFYVLCSGSPVLRQIQYLAAFGLVYCYIASAPILVFHAGRFLLKAPAEHGVSAAVMAGMAVVAGILVWWLVPPQQTPRAAYSLFVSAVVVGVFIVCLQGLIVWHVLRQSDRMWAFYKRLSDRRDDSNSGEIVDSYRHLREHGNSFFIVFLEIVLGIILVITSAVVGLIPPLLKGAQSSPIEISPLDERFVPLLLILIIWILPAVFVWVIATQFEREFGEQPPPSTIVPKN